MLTVWRAILKMRKSDAVRQCDMTVRHDARRLEVLSPAHMSVTILDQSDHISYVRYNKILYSNLFQQYNKNIEPPDSIRLQVHIGEQGPASSPNYTGCLFRLRYFFNSGTCQLKKCISVLVLSIDGKKTTACKV